MAIDQTKSLEARNKRIRKLKRKRNRFYISTVGIIAIIIISTFWGIRALSISVASADDIKEMIIGEEIYFDGNDIELTNENISSVEIINRTTEKNKEDNVNVRVKVIIKSKSFNVYSNVKLEYLNDTWVLKESNLGSVTNIEVNSNSEAIIIKEIENNGFETIEGTRYSGSTIRKIENVKLSSNNLENSSLFTAEVEITNGVCYQRGSISGKVIYDEETEKLNVSSMCFEGESKIYKENDIDENLIKSIIFEEVSNNYIYSFNDNGKVINYSIDKDNIDEFIINQYIIKDDYTIRAEVEGTVQQSNDNRISFEGFVSISGDPAAGDSKNSRDIIKDNTKKGM